MNNATLPTSASMIQVRYQTDRRDRVGLSKVCCFVLCWPCYKLAKWKHMIFTHSCDLGYREGEKKLHYEFCSNFLLR